MKKVILSIVTMFLLSISYGQNATITKEGNYIAIIQKDSAVKKVIDLSKLHGTGKCYTDKEGVKHPVYLSVNDKLYIVLTSKTGNMYRKYLKF